MKLSASLLGILSPLERRLAEAEDWRGRPYRCPAGKLTIGVGHNLDAEGLSDETIRAQLQHDIEKARQGAIRVAGDRTFGSWFNLSDVRREALIEMVFQLGTAGVLGFPKFCAAVRASDWVGAHREALDSKWYREDTPDRARRVAEALLLGKW